MNFSYILIGSTHGFVDDFSKQKQIILKVKPDFVLSEEMEEIVLDSKEKFEEILQKKIISNMTSFEEVEKLVNLCFEKNIKLIGIDLENFGFNENLQKKIKSQSSVSPEEEKELDEIVLSREKLHLEKILEYKKKTIRPLVIILGAWHLREDGLLRKNLKNYKMILPCDKEGNPLFGPGENKEVSYMEINSKKKYKE